MAVTAANKGSLWSIIPCCRAYHAMKRYHFFFLFFVHKSYINSFFIITKQSIYLSPSSLPLEQKVPALYGVKKAIYLFILFINFCLLPNGTIFPGYTFLFIHFYPVNSLGFSRFYIYLSFVS